jgi:hypothetical protein
MAISSTTAPVSHASSTLTQPTSAPAAAARSAGGYRRNPRKSGGEGVRGGPAKPRPPQEVVKTWAFDSVGNRKYALQIRKASNGNPCIKIVEGVPQPDGTFRKFDLTVWSEDWPRLFETLDALRGFIATENIRTPDGHKCDPSRRRGSSRKA